MTPTTEELRALVERLDNPADYEMTAVLFAEAAAMLRLWIAERERGEQKSVKGRHWQAYIEEYELEHGKGSFDATGE